MFRFLSDRLSTRLWTRMEWNDDNGRGKGGVKGVVWKCSKRVVLGVFSLWMMCDGLWMTLVVCGNKEEGIDVIQFPVASTLCSECYREKRQNRRW